MVEQLEDIKGYSKLSQTDKVKYAVALKTYLDDIPKDALENMDILEVRKSAFKIPVYYTIFMFGNLKRTITIKFKKSMLLKSIVYSFFFYFHIIPIVLYTNSAYYIV